MLATHSFAGSKHNFAAAKSHTVTAESRAAGGQGHAGATYRPGPRVFSGRTTLKTWPCKRVPAPGADWSKSCLSGCGTPGGVVEHEYIVTCKKRKGFALAVLLRACLVHNLL